MSYKTLLICLLVTYKLLVLIMIHHLTTSNLLVIITVPPINISDNEDEVKFIKKTPLHPRGRLKRLSKNQLIRNQTDKKITLKYYVKKGDTKK